MYFRFIILEIYSKCDIIVDKYNPCISYSNIGTDGISAFHFYLLVVTYKNKNVCYLDHDIGHYGNVSPSNFIYSILNSSVTDLLKHLVESPNDTIESSNNLYLMIDDEQIDMSSLI
jgi:hypothetical protein